MSNLDGFSSVKLLPSRIFLLCLLGAVILNKLSKLIDLQQHLQEVLLTQLPEAIAIGIQQAEDTRLRQLSDEFSFDPFDR
jgi:hypothetical protein